MSVGDGVVDFAMRVGDLLPLFKTQIKDDTGTPVVIPGGATFKFYMRRPGASSNKINGVAASVTNAPQGEVTYTWVAGDTDTVGLFYGKFTETVSSKPQTYPGNDDDDLLIKFST